MRTACEVCGGWLALESMTEEEIHRTVRAHMHITILQGRQMERATAPQRGARGLDGEAVARALLEGRPV